MPVEIAGELWTFEQAHGTQTVEGDAEKCVSHHDRNAVTISDDLPINEQLELAAAAALDLRRRSEGLIRNVPVIGQTSRFSFPATSPQFSQGSAELPQP